MRTLVTVGLLLITIDIVYPQDVETDGAPYLYYYSNVLKGIVIERADGTDSRVLGRGIVDEDVVWARGPGWSADGTWFAWHVEVAGDFYPDRNKGYAVHVGGENTLDLERFSCVHNMYWHPSENILLVFGAMEWQPDCAQSVYPVATLWLIDADDGRILSNFSLNLTADLAISPRPLTLYWQEDDSLIQFASLLDAYVDSYSGLDSYLVTMHFDGRATMEKMSSEDIQQHFADLTPSTPVGLTSAFTHWLETPDERIDGIPPAYNYDGGAVSSQWDALRQWVLIGHEACRAGCGGVTEEVGIFHPATGTHREVSDCGSHPACIGWLPDQVDIDALSPGKSESVLPTPVSIQYSDSPTYSRQLVDIQTHVITCNPENQRFELVTHIESGEVEFVLPAADSCESQDQREPIVFALGPSQIYYAITDRTQYTTLYSAETKNAITTLNFYGEELSFSADGRNLITTSTSVSAQWDIQNLQVLQDEAD